MIKNITKLLISSLLIIPLSAASYTYKETFSVTVENENSTVSPGGFLYLKIVGSTTKPDGKGNHSNVNIKVSDPSVVINNNRNLYYHVTEVMSTPRYIKIPIKQDISDTALPKTASIILTSGKNIFSVPFYIKEGTHGLPNANVPNGYYYINLQIKPGIQRWTEISCISSKTGFCNINIKEGEFDGKYTGRSDIYIHNHNCSDSGYPGTARLDVGSSVIFDASKLVYAKDNFTPPEGHNEIDLGACVIYSDNIFFIRGVSKVADRKTE